MAQSFNWTLQTMELLSDLHGVLSETSEEWNTFISLDADIGYFSDLDESPSNLSEFRHKGSASRSLRNIKEAFDRLRNHQQKLVSLRNSLAQFSLAVRWNLSIFSRSLFVVNEVPLTERFSLSFVCLLRTTKQQSIMGLHRNFQFGYANKHLANSRIHADLARISGTLSNDTCRIDIFDATFRDTLWPHPNVVLHSFVHSHRCNVCCSLDYEEVDFVAKRNCHLDKGKATGRRSRSWLGKGISKHVYTRFLS
jgi:hypothetical protein